MKNAPFQVFAVLCMVLTLIGCASYPITGHDLRDDPQGMIEFSVDEDHLTVYRRMLAASRACYAAKAFQVDGELFDEEGSAEITIAWVNVFYIAALHIAIRATGDSTTSVHSYYAPGLHNEWKAAAERTKQWANGNTGACQ